MANKKFSQFTAQTSLSSTTGFLVGYDSVLADNVRVSLANLKSSMGAFTLDSTLAAGGLITATRTINQNGQIVNWDNIAQLSFIDNVNTSPSFEISDDKVYAGFTGVNFTVDKSSNKIYTGDGTNVDGIFLDYNPSGPKLFYLGKGIDASILRCGAGQIVFGDLSFISSTRYIAFEESIGFFQGRDSFTVGWNVFNINFPNKTLELGDQDNHLLVSQDTFKWRNQPSLGTADGISLWYDTSGSGQIEGFFGKNNKTRVDINSGSNIMVFYNEQPIELNDISTGNMVSGSAGASSGLYLIVKVNGNSYKIDLLNMS